MMNEADVDTTYTALAQSIARVGEARSNLFLAALALDLLTQQPDAGAALAHILQAERLTKV